MLVTLHVIRFCDRETGIVFHVDGFTTLTSISESFQVRSQH